MGACDCKIKGSSKRFIDVKYSITEFGRKVFLLSVKVMSPCSNKCQRVTVQEYEIGLTILTFAGRTVLHS